MKKVIILSDIKPRPNDRNVPTQHIATLLGVTCCVRLATVLGVVGSSLKMVKFEPTTPNMSQQGGQTHATCCTQRRCDMLRSFGRGFTMSQETTSLKASLRVV